MKLHDLQGQAEALLDSMKMVPPREPGEKLRAADEAQILELHAAGHSQTDIARAVGCHQSTVSRTIADYDDSRPLARKYLDARAVDIAKRLVAEAPPAVALKLLGKLDVVRDDAVAGGTGDGGETRIYLGIGNLRQTWEGKPTAAIFEDGDVIVMAPSRRPTFSGEGKPLIPQVDRQIHKGGDAWHMFELPCPITDVPGFVKITPEAAKHFREEAKAEVIETTTVTDGGADAA
jgi:hypothetical protein